MKKLSVVLISLLFLFTGCKEELDKPQGGFSWYYQDDADKANSNPSVVQVGDPLIFESNLSDADYCIVWTGDDGHDYNKRNLSKDESNPDTSYVEENNVGITLKDDNGVLKTKNPYSYKYPGDYTIYFVSRNVDTETMDYVETIDSSEITVQDTLCELFAPPGEDPAQYKFVIVQPAELSEVEPVVEGTTVTIPAPAGLNVNDVLIYIKAGRSLISGDQILPPDNRGRIFFSGDLSSPKEIVISSVDESYSKTYTLQVEYGTPSSENDLTELSIAGFDGEISGSGVDVELPDAIDLDAVALDFTVSEHATVSIDGTDIASGDDINLSSGSVELTVTAQDGSTQVYTVTRVGIPTQMTALEFINLNPVVDADFSSAPNITATVFPGTDVTNLVPSITMTKFAQAFYDDGGTNVDIENGVTEIDFTNPVDIYIYTSIDTVQYTVTVSE